MAAIFDKILGKIREGEDMSPYAEKDGTPQILTVTNIKDLTSKQIDALKAGDIVVQRDTENIGDKVNPIYVERSTEYHVTLKKEDGDKEHGYCELVNIHENEITEVFYTKDADGEGWHFDCLWIKYINTPIVYKPSNNSYLDVAPDTMTVFNNSLSGTKTFSLDSAPDDGCAHIWHWRFSTGSTVPTIIWPGEIVKWAIGTPSVIEPNKIYEVSVSEGLATVIESI